MSEGNHSYNKQKKQQYAKICSNCVYKSRMPTNMQAEGFDYCNLKVEEIQYRNYGRTWGVKLELKHAKVNPTDSCSKFSLRW